jgi:hypothetical protein
MRELPITVALSLLVHAAAIGGYVSMDHSEPRRAVTKPAPSLEVAPREEVEVTLLADDTVTQVPDSDPTLVAAARSVATVARRDTAIVATTQTTTELPATTT